MGRTLARSGHERGSILVVGMLALTLMTLVGMAASNSGNLESEIAKNEKSYQQAMYAAELGLAQGEMIIEALPSRASFNEGTTVGHYAANSLTFDKTLYQVLRKVPGQSIGQPLKWDTESAIMTAVPDSMQWGSDRPRYTIEDRGLKEDSLGKGVTYGLSGAALFAVTSRGTGGGNASRVLMEVVVAKRFQ